MLRFSQLVIVVLIAAFLWLLRPQTIGGPAAYVTVDQSGVGSTLEPGDIAIVRRADSYAVGDLVAVESSDGPAMFGRVTAHEGSSYRIRFHAGAESVSVGQQYIIGRLWFNIGNLGRSVSDTVLQYFGLEREQAPER